MRCKNGQSVILMEMSKSLMVQGFVDTKVSKATSAWMSQRHLGWFQMKSPHARIELLLH